MSRAVSGSGYAPRPAGLAAGALVVSSGVVCGALLTRGGATAILVALAPMLLVALPKLAALAVPSPTNQFRLAAALLFITAVPWSLPGPAAVGFAPTSGLAATIKLALFLVGVVLACIRVSEARIDVTVAVLLGGYALIALVGGAIHGDGGSVVRSIRYAALVLSAASVAAHLSQRKLVSLVLAAALAVSGLSLLGLLGHLQARYAGRLQGYPVPMHPNLLGFVAASGALLAVGIWTTGGFRTWRLVSCLVVLGPTLVLSGSRTSLAALVVGTAVMMLKGQSRRTTGVVVCLVAVGCVIGFAQAATSYKALSVISTRGGSTTVTATLETRTSEWKAAEQANRSVGEKIFGQGLSAKTLAVYLPSAQYASVDGTWYAAYLSAGFLGILSLALFCVRAGIIAYRAGDHLLLGVVAFVTVTSPLTDVLNDVSVGLVVLLAVGAGRGYRRHDVDETGLVA